MGTWNTNINGNDTFQDIYQSFFNLYNQGQNPAYISKKIQDTFAEMFHDMDDRNHCFFAIAFAQWETKSLDPIIFNQVQQIIESGSDLEGWKALGADDQTIIQRKMTLEKFLTQISTTREKAKRRVRPKFEYAAIPLLTLPAPDGQKTFEIIESYVNGEYQETSSAISWASGGSSVFSFHQKGKRVSAHWVDRETLEIRHDKTIEFAKKDERFYFCGDQGIIRYLAE